MKIYSGIFFGMGPPKCESPLPGAFEHDERSSSGAIGSRLSPFWGSSVVSINVPVLGFLAPYPKTSAGDPRGHGNHQRDPHRRTGRDAGRGGGTGNDHHEQFDGGDFPVGHPEAGHPLVNVTAVGLVPLLPPNQPPEERERRIQDEIGERQHENRERGPAIPCRRPE
jgi:hypothetical protein